MRGEFHMRKSRCRWGGLRQFRMHFGHRDTNANTNTQIHKCKYIRERADSFGVRIYFKLLKS